MLYQADERRSDFAYVRASRSFRLGMRSAAMAIFVAALTMIATLQGWELGIPVWLGTFSFAFVAGLFLSAQKPDWHAKAAMAAGGLGLCLGLGALLLSWT